MRGLLTRRRTGLGLLVVLAAVIGLALALAGVADAASGPPVDSVAPSVSGTAKDGASLKAGKGTWTGAPTIAYAYQWQRCDAGGGGCEEIAGATAVGRRATHEDVGHTLRVIVTATNGLGSASATSKQTAVVVPAPPAKVVHPKITGAARDGQPLSVNTGTWKGTPPFTYSYEWEDCNLAGAECTIVAGAQTSTYRPTTAQINTRLRAIVTARNDAGNASASTLPSGKVVPGPPVDLAPPAISGSLTDGQTLTADTGTWAGTSPLSYSYQWERCPLLGGECEAVAGATGSTYSLGASDIASKLAVVVRAANGLGFATATSEETQPILAILPSNTVLPSISGLLQDGHLLSVATGTWSGSGPISYAYQWQQCNPLGSSCTDISEATGSSLQLSPADIGGVLQVIVTATNVAGSTSAATPVTGLIAGLLPSNTGLPSIGGLLQDGQLLSAVTGSWTGSGPISFTYQWQECSSLGLGCVNISGATAPTLKLLSGLIGSTLDVVVTATNVAGSTSTTTPVTGLIAGLLPSNTGLPSIGGLLQDGQLLSAAKGGWSGSEPISFGYQWQQCNAAGGSCSDIAGATGTTLKLLTGLIGSTVDVVVTATNAAGSTSATSSASGPIAGLLPSNTGLPSISGVLQEGQTPSVSTGTWSGTAPITYSYQWQQCNAAGGSCVNISGATAPTLKLLSGLIGSTLDVVVTATNVAGSTSTTTPASGLVAGILPSNTALPSISGLLKLGKTLTAATGAWSGTSPITYAYQWQLCNVLGSGCSNIAGATSSTFLLGVLDVGLPLRVVVTASNVAGSTPATSGATGLISAL